MYTYLRALHYRIQEYFNRGIVRSPASEITAPVILVVPAGGRPQLRLICFYTA